VRDAARLRLAGGLVTLSACETAISAVMPGDELIGLTHAFISAGATRVLASLWTVQDEAAASFMPRFYERLRADGQPAQALRATQIETLVHHPHPYFWAPFTLHGGW
jgi:CHAT domain-containing protein